MSASVPHVRHSRPLIQGGYLPDEGGSSENESANFQVKSPGSDSGAPRRPARRPARGARTDSRSGEHRCAQPTSRSASSPCRQR